MSLLNQSAVHDYILQQIKEKRPGWDCTQVAGNVYKIFEDKLKIIMDKAIHSHPSLGKTFRDIL
jgi:hypothetical protein